jgi:glycosidase
MRQIFRLLVLMAAAAACAAQVSVTRVEPPNWWAGMHWNTVQLMLTGTDLAGATVRSSTPFLNVLRVRSTGNPSYAFVDVRISPATPGGAYRLTVSKKGSHAAVDYPVLAREPARGRHQGFTAADVLYLITPDRFANGDTTNDAVPGMRDGYRPTELIGRHGGDLRGIRDHLDYIRDLGVTAVWINPLIENNTEISYHGYAATDFYAVDRRFGTNEEYRALVAEAHARGLKVVLDHVSNHMSIYHPWVANLPSAGWLNGSVEQHQQTRHDKISLSDVHGDPAVRSNLTDGWFTGYMPDLNQRDPLLANYLIQNTLWWIEYAGLDGIREDTYPYADQGFLARWASAILTEYPAFNIVGEVWIHDPAFLAPYQSGSALARRDTHLPSVTDFGMFEAFMKVFGDDRADISVLYETVAKDFLYPHPEKLVTFLDNHDVARIMYVCRDQVDRCTMALTLLLTMRGIPVLYYGTEIEMIGGTDHGEIRGDFPGGFPHPVRNAFTSAGRTSDENGIFDFLKNLLALRKKHPALAGGTFLHYPPKDNVYAYLRASGGDSVLVVANNGATAKTVDLRVLAASLGAPPLRDLVSGAMAEAQGLLLPANSARILAIGRR